MILIPSPLSKPCEPPAGIARLAGAIAGKGSLTIIDANLDGILRALNGPVDSNDTWTRRAKKNLQANLNYLRHNNHPWDIRSEEHTSELQSRLHLACRLL